MSASAADDSDSARGFPADADTEDLQVSSAAARTAVLHDDDASGLQAADCRRRRDEGRYVAGQRTQAKDGERRKAGGMAEYCRPVAGQYQLVNPINRSINLLA